MDYHHLLLSNTSDRHGSFCSVSQDFLSERVKSRLPIEQAFNESSTMQLSSCDFLPALFLVGIKEQCSDLLAR